MPTEEQKQTRVAWDKVAAGYDEFVTPTYFGLGAEALRRAGFRPGMRLLDVAAGSGAVSLAAARLGANVTSVDISPVMVERLKRRAHEEGLNVQARVMDGHALDLENDTFDMVVSEFGVMLFPDLPRGLCEMARVTKPGGRVVVVAFGSPMKIEFFQFFIRAVQSAVPGFTGPPMDPLPLPFQVQDPEKLRREMINAGLKDVRDQRGDEVSVRQTILGLGDEQQPNRRNDLRTAESEQGANSCDPAGDGRLDPRARRRERHGDSAQPNQHWHRDEMKVSLRLAVMLSPKLVSSLELRRRSVDTRGR